MAAMVIVIMIQNAFEFKLQTQYFMKTMYKFIVIIVATGIISSTKPFSNWILVSLERHI